MTKDERFIDRPFGSKHANFFVLNGKIMNPQNIPYRKLFFSFLKLGLTAFGGPAMVAYIKELAVNKNKWLTGQCFQNGVAICQSIPGATAMQMAAYVGLRTRGVLGALCTYIGFGLPAFLLMLVFSTLYQRFANVNFVMSLFNGLQLIVIAIVANATLSFAKNILKTWADIVFTILAATFLLFNGNPILAILGCAVLGVFIYSKNNYEKINAQEVSLKSKKNSAGSFALLFIFLLGLLLLFLFDKKLFKLAYLMARIDLFAFGGGYASLPLMFHEVVKHMHWLSSKVFMDGIALGQVTPGPIVITSTFVGYLCFGIIGALVATISMFSPSIIVLTFTVPYFDKIQHNVYFKRALNGVLVSFVGLLLAVTVKFSFAVDWSLYKLLITILAFIALYRKVDILWVVMAGAIISIFTL